MEYIIERLIWAWNDLKLLLILAMFLAYFVYDWIWAHYMISVTNLKATSAATLGSVIYIIGVFGVLNYVENLLYTIPMVVGGWLGTYYAVKREKKRGVPLIKKPL